MLDDIFDQIHREKIFSPKMARKSDVPETDWNFKIDLENIPTKPEDIKVKIDAKADLLTVAGKSEILKNRKNGMKIKSNHAWTQNIKIPENVDQKTISSKIHNHLLLVTAKLKEDETKAEYEIPIQIE